MSDQVTYGDTLQVLHRMGDTVERIVLVGGQALNFWAEHYLSQVPELADDGPYASKDIDFMGTRAQVRECAIALGARATYPKPGDITPSAGKVIYLDSRSEEREIDFLTEPFGLAGEPLWDLSFPVTVTSVHGAVRARILHPFHCLKSRVSNTAGLPGYSTPHALNQLRASVKCMRAFVHEMLDAGETAAVLEYNEKLFKFSRDSRYASAAP